MRHTRRGESVLEAIGGLIVAVAVVAACVWYFTGKNPLADKRVSDAVHTVLPEPPKPVVLQHGYDYNVFENSNHIVTVQNAGGAGNVKVTSRVYADAAERRPIGTFSAVVYLQKGQQQEVVIPLKGVKEGLSTVYARASAEAQ